MGSILVRLKNRTSLATPIISYSFQFQAPLSSRKGRANLRCFPTGSSPGQAVRAVDSLTTATGSSSSDSCGVKARPRTMGVLRVEK